MHNDFIFITVDEFKNNTTNLYDPSKKLENKDKRINNMS